MKTEKISRNSPARSLLQKFYGNPKPVRQYQRLGKEKTADTGYDPRGAMLEFIKHDIIRPLERVHLPPEAVPKSDKWAIGTTKKCLSIDKLPKLEALKDYNFPEKTNLEPIKQETRDKIKTDHISIIVPKVKKNNDSESFLNLKNKMGSHTETYKDSWIPQGNHKTMNNRSSVAYNILNYNNNETSGAMMSKVYDKKLNNKKKGVAEFMDLTKPFHPNFNQKFADNYSTHKNIFHVYNGVFSHMYDAAHRNGNIVVPFRNNNATATETNHNQSHSPKNFNKKTKSPKKEH